MLKFEESGLVKRLARLDAPSRVAFTAACATRLLPGYREYAAARKKGDPGVLSETLERIWRSLIEEESPPIETRMLERAVMQQAPEELDDWTPLDAYAEDAVDAIAYVLDALASSDPQDAAWAARTAYTAVDEVARYELDVALSEPGAEAQILAHPSIQQELSRQQRDLEELETRGPDASTFSRLRERALAESAFELA